MARRKRAPPAADVTSSVAPIHFPEAVVTEAQAAVRHLRRIRRVPGVTEMIGILDRLTSE